MNRTCWIAAVACACGALGSGKAVADAAAPVAPAPIEYSLLQPGLTGEYYVGTFLDLTMLGSGFGNVKRTKELRQVVQREGYDAPTQLAAAMQAELEKAGSRTELEPVRRGPPGEPVRLTRADLPAQPKGRFLIDLEIRQLGFAAEANLAAWEPFFTITWRVLGPHGELIVPSHTYQHGPYTMERNAPQRTQGCNLPSYAETMKSPAVAFDCMNQGFRDAAALIVPALREAQARSGVR